MFAVQCALWKSLVGISVWFVSLQYVELSGKEHVNRSHPSEDSAAYPAPGLTSANPTQAARGDVIADFTQPDAGPTVPEPPDTDEIPDDYSSFVDPYYYYPPYEYDYQDQDLGPIVLPSIDDNETQWKDILPNMTALMGRLCGYDYLCSSSFPVGGGGSRGCAPCHSCYCDSGCHRRGDCCLDKLVRDAAGPIVTRHTPVAPSMFGCYDVFFQSDLSQAYFPFVDSCPLHYDDTDVLNKCLKPSSATDNLFHSERLRANWPVWSNASSFSYRNKFCALCHGEESTALHEWDLSVKCFENMGLFNADSSKALIDRALNDELCDLAFFPPTTRAPVCAPAQDEYIETCNVTGRRMTYDPLLWHGCHERSFRSLFTVVSVTYFNVFCALCNLGDEESQVRGFCDPSDDTPFPLVLVMSASILGQIPDNLQEQDRCRCLQDQVYDPYEHECRPLQCSMTRKLEDQQCVVRFSQISGLLYGFSITLKPSDAADVFIPAAHTMDIVANMILICFQEKLNSVFAYGFRIENFRVITRVPAIPPALESIDVVIRENVTNGSPPVQVNSFMAKATVSVTRVESSSHLNSIEKQLLQMTRDTWNFSVDLANSREFRASPYYDDRADNVSEYIEPTPLTSDGTFLDYALDVQFWSSKNNQAYIPVTDSLLCAKVLVDVSGDSLPSNTFQMNRTTGSVFHRPSGTTISFENVEVLQDGKALVCADRIYSSLTTSTAPALPENLFPASVINVSIVCQSLSVVSLFLVFFTYCLFPELRTLPGKNTLGLVTTLFLAMLLFEVGVARVELPTVCVVVGVLVHYLLLSSFTWMLVCSFHMYRIFTRLLDSHVQKTDRETWTLVKYILITTAVPSLVVGSTLLANYLAHRDRCFLDVGYGVGICYLSNRWSLILASAVPISVMVLVNLALFLRTVTVLRSVSQHQKRFVRQQHRQLIMYTRMSTLTGINWLAGLAAASVNSAVMWHVFSVLCGLQGLYVFAAFVCNERVYRLYRRFLCPTLHDGNSSSTAPAGRVRCFPGRGSWKAAHTHACWSARRRQAAGLPPRDQRRHRGGNFA